MATIKQGILGGFSGSVGSVVGTAWKGISVMKSKPVSVANPKTAGQVNQRSNFSACVLFAQSILSTVIKPLWDRFASGMSGYNDFISTNISVFSNGSIGTVSDFVISKGKMAATAMATAVADISAKTVVVSWLNDAGQGFKLAGDLAYVVIINESTPSYYGFSTGVLRSALSATVTLPDAFSEEDTISAFLAFKRADGTIVSDSSYKNCTIQA